MILHLIKISSRGRIFDAAPMRPCPMWAYSIVFNMGRRRSSVFDHLGG